MAKNRIAILVATIAMTLGMAAPAMAHTSKPTPIHGCVTTTSTVWKYGYGKVQRTVTTDRKCGRSEHITTVVDVWLIPTKPIVF